MGKSCPPGSPYMLCLEICISYLFVVSGGTYNLIVSVPDQYTFTFSLPLVIRLIRNLPQSNSCNIQKTIPAHRGLIHKLRSVGLSGSLIDWLSDYLDNRQQRVCLQNCTSTWQTINAGVPQGSILGPLMFLIFMNDIVKILRVTFAYSPMMLFCLT